MKPQERAKQLAADHWGYIEKLLEAHGYNGDSKDIIGFHYRTAMEHGYGHGVEDERNGIFGNKPLPTANTAQLCNSCFTEECEIRGEMPFDTCVKYHSCLPQPFAGEDLHKGAATCALYNGADGTCQSSEFFECYKCEDYVAKGVGGLYIYGDLCPSCTRTDCAKEEYPATKDGGCEGYISALRENILDAKGTAPLCISCGVQECEAADAWRNICSLYVAKQEAPTAAVLPTTHTDPSTNCKDCHNAVCVGKGRNLTCDQGCERFIPKELAQ